MIEISRDPETGVVTSKLSGTVLQSEFDPAIEELAEVLGPGASVRVRGGGGVRLGVVLDWRELEGWEKGAKSIGTMIAMSLRDVIGHVAIIGDPKWKDEQDRIADICKQAQVRFFESDRHDEALGWLQGS